MNDTAHHMVEQTFPVADRESVGLRQRSSTPGGLADQQRDVLAWLARRPIYIQIVQADDYWYAEALEFRTVATGETREEAVEVLRMKLRTYFNSCRARRQSKTDVLRPGTPGRYCKVRALALLARLTGSLFVVIQRESLARVEFVPQHS